MIGTERVVEKTSQEDAHDDVQSRERHIGTWMCDFAVF